ncbi:MAG: hypothetical protein IJB79_01230 [Candidatus Gastranaerophilales bacterium]|nr:hypothetical protein [Candidatus Gastranaerophilales bacterium]
MNQLIAKRTAIFALMLGALIGLISLVPYFIGLSLFVLSFFSSVIVMLYMKKGEKHISYLTNEQGAIMGGIVGFFCSIGFFITFSPMVCILRLIFKQYYAYMIPDMLHDALWLFFVVVFMVALIFALTNSATGMGTTWILSHIEKEPENLDARLDIKIEE